MKKIVAIIPARMASTRFPGKPLADICGLPMIEHVRRRVLLCKQLSAAYVATCDKEIKKAVEKSGGAVIMTSAKHQMCTDRVAEAAEKLDADIIINVQGDEPLINPDIFPKIIKPMLEDNSCKCINLISPIIGDEEFKSPNAVKTTIDLKKNILFFSREPIPSNKKYSGTYKRYKQVGLIVFAKDMLAKFAKMKRTPLEIVESVDMLRLIENGYSIKAVIADEPSYGVDTPEDLSLVKGIMEKDPLYKKYI
jgi:3-deoxy-manno-octulosonate cytidylyltransferase (CMP-KDO synthetase)